MPITIEASTIASGVNIASLDVNRPSGFTADSLGLLIAGFDNGTQTDPPFTVSGTGWDELARISNNPSTDDRQAMIWEQFNPPDATTTITPAVTDDVGAFYLRIEDVDSTTPVDAVGLQEYGTTVGGANFTVTNTVTTVTDNALAICIVVFDGADGGNPITFGSSGVGANGWGSLTTVLSSATGGGVTVAYCTKLIATAGDAGQVELNPPANDGWGSIMIALRLAAGGPTPVEGSFRASTGISFYSGLAAGKLGISEISVIDNIFVGNEGNKTALGNTSFINNAASVSFDGVKTAFSTVNTYQSTVLRSSGTGQEITLGSFKTLLTINALLQGYKVVDGEVLGSFDSVIVANATKLASSSVNVEEASIFKVIGTSSNAVLGALNALLGISSRIQGIKLGISAYKADLGGLLRINGSKFTTNDIFIADPNILLRSLGSGSDVTLGSARLLLSNGFSVDGNKIGINSVLFTSVNSYNVYANKLAEGEVSALLDTSVFVSAKKLIDAYVIAIYGNTLVIDTSLATPIPPKFKIVALDNTRLLVAVENTSDLILIEDTNIILDS